LQTAKLYKQVNHHCHSSWVQDLQPEWREWRRRRCPAILLRATLLGADLATPTTCLVLPNKRGVHTLVKRKEEGHVHPPVAVTWESPRAEEPLPYQDHQDQREEIVSSRRVVEEPEPAEDEAVKVARELEDTLMKMISSAEAEQGLNLILSPSATLSQKRRGLRLLRNAAERGHAEAAHNLGVVYLEGVSGVSACERSALRWFTLAAERGYSHSAHNLAAFYSQGLAGLKSDANEARLWTRRALDLEAVEEEEVCKDQREECFPPPAQRPDSDVLYRLGRAHQSGIMGAALDPQLAEAYYAESAALGHAKAAAALASLRRPARVSLAPSRSQPTLRAWTGRMAGVKRSRSLARLDSLDSGVNS